MSEATRETNANHDAWTALIPDDQWTIYTEAIRVTRKTGAPFVLGGAFGLAAYTGRWRNTKDLDFFVLPEHKDKMVDALTKNGFDDYFSTHEYDRGWIYRAVKNSVIVDTIWQTPNRRTQVDAEWFKRGRIVSVRGEQLMALPAEELLAIKCYVIQRDRCDWPDLINLLYATCDQLDWDHVLHRMQRERPLLAGLLQVFNWVCPDRARTIPQNIRRDFSLPEPASEELALPANYRVELLDSRKWFAAFQPADEPMKL
jgi:hypothetical protein